ncbi:putative ribonuclease H-like domain-containing protein [Tanacetum coccineum]
MESQSETTQTVSALKFLVLKTREYDIWSMRMEQYLTFIDHVLWGVIVNGDSVSPIASASAGVEGHIPPKTAKQKLARKNELKPKITLMLAIPNEHLLKFHDCKDANQISAKDKTGLGYDSHMNESEVVHSVFNSRESNVDDSPINDRFKTGEGFYAVPPPYTRNYMPPRPDLSFAGKDIVEKPKTIRPSAPIIEEWDTDSDNDSVFRPKSDQTKPKFTKMNFVKSGENVKSVNKENTHRQVEYPRKSQSPRDNRRNWNGMMTQKLGNGFEFINKACFICRSFNHLIKDCDFHDNKMVENPVLNNKGRVTGQREMRPVWNNAQGQSSPKAAASISTAMPVNTAPPKLKVKDALPATYSYFKAHSPGNLQYTLQDQGIFDSGCSRHMTGNKSFLTDYQEIDGGFVAFGGSPKGGKITGKGKIRTGKLDFEDVYFVKELKFNLFSVSQMCDKKNSVLFTETECLVLSPDFKLLDESQVLLKVPRQNNMYSFDLKNVVPSGGFPSKLFENDHTCVVCQKGKQHKASCKAKLVISISQPLQMLHMDLFGPTSVRSINHKTYCLVVTDDFSRFSWVFFLATKDETSGILKTFITGIENQINHKVKIIRCDNGIEFKNNDMNQFCGVKGIKREFSVARTPQQNGVAERKNMTLIEATRTMLADSLLPTTFWAEAVNTACYVHNRVLVTKPHNKTPYELLHGRPPSISFMRPFGCPMTILNTLDPLGKFDGKADEGFLVGYSINSKAFRSGPDWLFDNDLLTNSMNYEPVTAGNQTNRNVVANDAGKKITKEPANEGERNGQEKEGETSNKEGDQHVQDLRAELDKLLVQQKEGYANSTNIVSTISPSVSATGKSFVNDLSTDPLMPDLEDTTDLLNTGIFSGAYDDEDVGEEADLNNLETTMNVSPILTTKIHKDHPKEQIIRDPLLAPQTRRMTKSAQEHAMMDVKSAFLNGTIEEKVYVCQPSRFEDPRFPNKVYKVKQKDDGIFISQDKYVANILNKFDFVTVKTANTPIETNKALLKNEEGEDMDVHLYRSMIGSLMYLSASRPNIMFVVCACVRYSPFDLEAFSDIDYAGASLDRKSTTGGVVDPKSNA